MRADLWKTITEIQKIIPGKKRRSRILKFQDYLTNLAIEVETKMAVMSKSLLRKNRKFNRLETNQSLKRT